MLRNNSKRLLSLLLAIIMVIGIMPVSVVATGATGSVTSLNDFVKYLEVLEGYANEYHESVPGSKDPGELVLNFIRTGVERYRDDNWTTLAGQELTGFVNYVAAQDTDNNTTAMYLRDIKAFTLPNGNAVDFGHMFGCMNISYVAKGSADLSGWAGDLCDLLDYSVRMISDINANTDGTVEGMTAYIGENCFGVDASDAFGWDDFYGDMDAYYLVSEYKKGTGSFSALMKAYFTDELSDVERSVYFMNNRFGVEDSNEAVRKAIYESYSADVGIKILESKRGLSSYNNLRQACCYALADYIYSQAKGKLIEGTGGGSTGPENGYYTVFSNEHSILAPGITQDINYAQTADGKQIVYYVATVDVTREDVTIMANYKDNDPSKGWGLQSVRDQVGALIKNNKDKYEYFNPIVATNGDGYNITNGTPGGLLVMGGVEYYPVDKDGFFAILKDGTAMIGTKDDYAANKDKIQEAIGGFGAVLVKDGKINVTKNANYTSSRASRTAIGIKADGSVVMMVLDGRQLPRSAGGAMEEIATIMLEAGCVHAINLDGGGSTTYLSKPAGKDDIQLVNVPSDGYERQVSVSLVAVSTAPPSTAFDHAVISSDYEYITAGTSMQFSVTGVSNTGNAAVIPEGSYWKVSDSSLASIDANGLFTAAANGDVTVQYIVNGEVVGEKIVHIIIPDDIKFVEDRITAIYGEPKKIDVTVWYHGYPVAFTPLKDAFVFFDYEFDQYGNPNLYFTSDVGYINGLDFVGNDSKGIRNTTIYAALLIGRNIIATMATVNLYYKDEATFDFENATQGNRKLAWYREIENAKSTDNMLYRISDPNSPVKIDYTFALDITAIDFPVQLESLKSMLPTYQENATAWTYMLQLAERVCTQTNVTIRAEFSPDLEVDISGLKIINEYFTLTSADLDENNVLTLVCNWVNQSQPIDAATANPLCILAGITATVKDTAAYYNNEILIANNGYVSYDVYLAASSLYSFAEKAENQAQYGLYPYIHEDDCRGDFSSDFGDDETLVNNDKGAHFSSQYIDFADTYLLNNEIRQGWQEEGNDYYYYKDNEPLTGVQLVPDRHDATKDRFYEFDETGKLINESAEGVTGLVTFKGDLYYAIKGEAQTGWQVIDGNNYYFHLDTCKALDGVQKIKELVRPDKTETKTATYTYTFTDYILTKGEFCYEYDWSKEGYKWGTRYRWAGNWMKACWFEVDGDTYYVTKDEPWFITKGYARYIKNYPNESDLRNYLFDENGVLQKDYSGPADVVIGGVTKTIFFKNGEQWDDGGSSIEKRNPKGLHEGSDGYYYYVDTWEGEILKNTTRWITSDDLANGLVPVGSPYIFDAQGRLTNSLATPKPDASIKDKVTTETIGKVVTVTVTTTGEGESAKEDFTCKVGYVKNGEYFTIEATENANGSYNFAAPENNLEIVIILSGDINGDGTVNDADSKALAESLLPGSTDVLDEAEKWAADVNDNGKLNSADKILIARSKLPKDHPLYLPLEW
ncbi:MAG: phosphodiester glycosidase family protein [Clostridia bacterium]|nr:phosphodiester glycosidase family protein [Clostridia bacterium]